MTVLNPSGAPCRYHEAESNTGTGCGVYCPTRPITRCGFDQRKRIAI